MTYPNVYASQTGPLSLSGLDANFLYAVDIANGALSATAGGTADAITATYSPAPAALVAGLTLYLRAASANATTTPQFSPNGLTGKVIVKNNNQALAVGDIAGAGHWLQLVYDATNGVWELMNPATVVGAVQTGGTANGVAYLNASKVITSGTALTFDGTNLTSLGTITGTKLIPTGTSVTGNGLYLPAANALGLSTNGTNAVYIDSSQNVGIGTSSPAGKLEVSSAANIVYSTGTAGLGAFYARGSGTNSSYSFWGNATNGEQGRITVENGGAFVISNTASVTERMRIDSSGNVGIGTSSPGYNLQVNSAASTIVAVSSSNTASFPAFRLSNTGASGRAFQLGLGGSTSAYPGQFYIYDETAATVRMLFDTSGNVGIGVTPSAWGSNRKVLQVGSYASILSDNANATLQVSSNAYNNGTNNIYINTSYATLYQSYLGQHQWYIAPSGTAGNTITFTQAMTLDASGNLGIGTSSPAAKFQVSGASETRIFTTNSTASVTAQTGAETSTAYVGSYTNHPLVIRTNDTERVRIDTVGNAQFQAGAVMPYAPAPAAVSAATTLTNANIQGQIISATGTTYTITMPLGTTLETLATWATTNIGYDFFVINTASGTITMAVNTGVTSLGSLTVAIGASAHFRIRRTAANTFVLYRLV